MKAIRFPFSHTVCFKIFLAISFLIFLNKSAGAEITRDGTMGPKGSIAGPAYKIPDTDGTRAGNNLFHSFGRFNIAKGESATFSNSGAPLNNVIARVTGGPSAIDGLVRSTIDGANMFFLNPAGIMFGPNANIDVSGSFHVSTADYLKFNDGSVFYGNISATSVLSVADPAAFGFLGSNPAAISGDNAYLRAPVGKTISIVGGDIIYKGTPADTDDLPYVSAVLTAAGGTINLVSVASPGEVDLVDMSIDTFKTLGDITFSDGAKLSVINFDQDGYPQSAGGKVIIRGGIMTFTDGGIDAYGNPGGEIDVRGGDLHLDNYYFFPSNFNWGFDPEYAANDHPGTACRINLSGDLLMTHAAFIDTQNVGVGKGGDISIHSRKLLLGDEIVNENSFTDIGLYGYIGSPAAGSGPGGNIDIYAENITVRNGFSISNESYEGGDTGDVNVTAIHTLQITDQGRVGIYAFGYGNGGIINISARDIIISAENETAVTDIWTTTGIVGQTSYWANGGQINLIADKLQILDGGQISSVLYDYLGYGAFGRGTDVNIQAGEIVVSGYVEDPRFEDSNFGNPSHSIYMSSGVDARVIGPEASGLGGNISIITDHLKLTDRGNIATAIYFDAPGNAGDININAASIEITDIGKIYADSFRGTGNSGNIAIAAENMNITGTGKVPPPDPLDFNFTGLSTTTLAGGGGAIKLNLAGDLLMTAAGGIKADTSGSGIGGAIDIAARNISLNNMASINASSSGLGNAGDITVTAGNCLNLYESFITTEASMDADGGNINISAPYMVHLIDSRITSSVGGGPETAGGNIVIDPQYVILNDSKVIANAYEGTGGNISVIADHFLQDPGSEVSASSALGVSGAVDIQAPISNISGLIAPLNYTFVPATDLLRERCIARIHEGKYSSFIVGGRDGIPQEPGNLMPSILY